VLGHVFIAKVYINSNIEIEIEIEVTMYYFQSLKWEKKNKKGIWIGFLF
jgi:hypothetical protein